MARHGHRPAGIDGQTLGPHDHAGEHPHPAIAGEHLADTALRPDPDAQAARALDGAAGRPRPDQLKVSVGYQAGHRAEAGISYAGPGCVERARLAGDVVNGRLGALGKELRIDVVGSLSEGARGDVAQCWLRVAGMTRSLDEAQSICHEVESLYTNGPAGGGGVRTQVTEVIGIVSTLVDRDAVNPTTTLLEVS